MIRINLLPHRDERRKASRRQLGMLAAGFAILGLVIAAAVHGIIAGYVSAQNERNEFLKTENAKLDKQIAEIRKLRDEIRALLSRKQIIETLQTDRAQTVHLLDDLVKRMPEGVYLKSLSQKGLRINLLGYAQSNARVSTLMRNIEASPWLGNPELVEVKAANVGNRRIAEFNMYMSLKRAAVEAPKPAAKPPAPQKKG